MPAHYPQLSSPWRRDRTPLCGPESGGSDKHLLRAIACQLFPVTPHTHPLIFWLRKWASESAELHSRTQGCCGAQLEFRPHLPGCLRETARHDLERTLEILERREELDGQAGLGSLVPGFLAAAALFHRLEFLVFFLPPCLEGAGGSCGPFRIREWAAAPPGGQCDTPVATAGSVELKLTRDKVSQAMMEECLQTEPFFLPSPLCPPQAP